MSQTLDQTSKIKSDPERKSRKRVIPYSKGEGISKDICEITKGFLVCGYEFIKNREISMFGVRVSSESAELLRFQVNDFRDLLKKFADLNTPFKEMRHNLRVFHGMFMIHLAMQKQILKSNQIGKIEHSKKWKRYFMDNSQRRKHLQTIVGKCGCGNCSSFSKKSKQEKDGVKKKCEIAVYMKAINTSRQNLRTLRTLRDQRTGNIWKDQIDHESKVRVENRYLNKRSTSIKSSQLYPSRNQFLKSSRINCSQQQFFPDIPVSINSDLPGEMSRSRISNLYLNNMGMKENSVKRVSVPKRNSFFFKRKVKEGCKIEKFETRILENIKKKSRGFDSFRRKKKFKIKRKKKNFFDEFTPYKS